MFTFCKTVPVTQYALSVSLQNVEVGRYTKEEEEEDRNIYLFVVFVDMLWRVLYFEKEPPVTHMPTY